MLRGLRGLKKTKEFHHEEHEENKFIYDAYNRRIEKVADSNGSASGGVASQFYIYDNTDVILDLYDADAGGQAFLPVVWNRYLWNPQMEDQLLAQEIACFRMNRFWKKI